MLCRGTLWAAPLATGTTATSSAMGPSAVTEAAAGIAAFDIGAQRGTSTSRYYLKLDQSATALFL